MDILLNFNLLHVFAVLVFTCSFQLMDDCIPPFVLENNGRFDYSFLFNYYCYNSIDSSSDKKDFIYILLFNVLIGTLQKWSKQIRINFQLNKEMNPD